jgi:hypothetical protein
VRISLHNTGNRPSGRLICIKGELGRPSKSWYAVLVTFPEFQGFCPRFFSELPCSTCTDTLVISSSFVLCVVTSLPSFGVSACRVSCTDHATGIAQMTPRLIKAQLMRSSVRNDTFFASTCPAHAAPAFCIAL